MLRTLFVLSILVPGTYAALRNRYAALLMYLWFALFRPQDWVWIDITSLRVSLVLGLLLLVPAILNGRFPNFTHPLSVGMGLFVAASVLSQATAVRPDVGWQWVDFMVRLVLACTMLVTLTSEAWRLVGVIAVIAGSLGFHAAKAGLAFAAGGGTRFGDGLSGAFVDNNGYALGTVMIIPLVLIVAQNIEFIYSGRWVRWVRFAWYAAVPLCVFAVIGTYSRGGFLALSVAIGTFVLLQRQRVAALATSAACVLLLVLVVPIPQSYIDRLQTIRTYEEIGEDSALSRPHFWDVGVQMGLARPLGVGIRQYEAAYDEFDTSDGRFGNGRSVHSSHVQVFAELGIIGATLWVALFAYAAFTCMRVRVRSRDARLSPAYQRLFFTAANGLLTSMAGFLVGGAFLTLALNDLTWLTFGLVASLDYVSQAALAIPAAAAKPVAAVPLAFRAVDSFGAAVTRNDRDGGVLRPCR